MNILSTTNPTNSGATYPVSPQSNTINSGATSFQPQAQNINSGATNPPAVIIPPVVPPVLPPTPPATGGGGGGGAVTTQATACSDVIYGQWGRPANGYQYRDVINQIPVGCRLTASQQEARSRRYQTAAPAAPVVLAVKYYPDGSLLRGPDWKIYAIVDRKKEFIKNWGDLFRKYRSKPIINLAFEVLAQYPEVLGKKIYQDGSLIRGKNKKIYVIVDGGKQLIKNLKELRAYKNKKINNVSDEVSAGYPDLASKAEAGQASLVRGTDKKIYLIVNGKRKHLKNLTELINYRGREITYMSNKALDGYPPI